MKIVQIKGSNGSGKTTIVKNMMALSSEVDYLINGGKCYATLMEDIGWIAVGKYMHEKAMGGCDTLSSVEEIKTAVLKAMDVGFELGCWVVFEGMMISTIKSTFYDYLLNLAKVEYIEPLFVILETTPSGCVRRIEGRGTKKPNLKFENIVGKCTGVLRHAITYDQKYVRWLDVENTSREDMLPTFLKLVGDDELFDMICLGEQSLE